MRQNQEALNEMRASWQNHASHSNSGNRFAFYINPRVAIDFGEDFHGKNFIQIQGARRDIWRYPTPKE
jgi:hypothetical protein